jgi:nucleoside-diphosphate-sugar epimerase
MKVLIIGAHGFTGCHLFSFLTNINCQVAGGARNGDNIQTYQLDLLDKSSLIRTLVDFQPNIIIHLAGIAFPGFHDVELMYQINMIGTKNLLDAVLESGISIKKLIASSSSQVYGVVENKPISESHPTLPVSHYANSKLGMENICRLYMDKLPIIITRPFNYTGREQSTNYVLAKIVDHYRNGASEIFLGNIEVVRDFSYIDDIVNYYWALMNCSDSGFAVNLCSGQGHSLRELIEHLNRIAGYEMNVHSSNALLRSNDNGVFIGDNSLLNRYLNDYVPLSINQLLLNMYAAH